jgi:hypothetical protein
MRRTTVVIIPGEFGKDPSNRDAGKHYLLTEWPASYAEDWGMRAVLAIAHSGIDLPDGTVPGMAGIAVASLQAITKLNTAEAVGLLNELMQCVKAMPDPTKPEITRNLIESDIEEVMTRLLLKGEVFKLHTGFSFADVPSRMASALRTTISPESSSEAPSTSPQPSPQ